MNERYIVIAIKIPYLDTANSVVDLTHIQRQIMDAVTHADWVGRDETFDISQAESLIRND